MKAGKLLLLFWIIATILYANQIKLFDPALQGRYTEQDLSVTEIENGGMATRGIIKSNHPGLGNILVRLADNKDITDRVTFRIRELGSSRWIYEGSHDPKNFVRGDLYPFGFPVIKDSGGKTYEFEIYIGDGSKEETILTDPQIPVLLSRHFISIREMEQRPALFFYFISRKIFETLFNTDMLWMSFFFMVPFILYVIYHESKKTPFVFYSFILILPVLAVLSGVAYHDILYIWIILFLIFASYRNKIDPKIYSYIAIVFLFIATVSKILGSYKFPEKLAIWSLSFLTTGATLSLIGLKKENNKYIPAKEFFSRLFDEISKIAHFTYLVALGDIEITAKKVDGKQVGRIKYHKIALIIYQLGKPIRTTYIVTTRLAYLLIILSIVLLKLSIKYGPYLVLGYSVFALVNKVNGYIFFFNDFYITDQTRLFWNNLGNSLVVLYLISVVIFFFMQRKQKALVKKVYLGIVVLYICSYITTTLFSGATPQRDKTIIWLVRPNETGEPWVDVNIMGRNFSEMPFVGKILVDGKEQRIIRWTDREIIFRTNPTITRSGKLTVVMPSGKESNSVDFKYLLNNGK